MKVDLAKVTTEDSRNSACLPFHPENGPQKGYLVGHSRGGYLVTRLTLEHLDRVKTCTIVDSSTTATGVNR